MRSLLKIVEGLVAWTLLAMPLVLVAALARFNRTRRLVWGTTPIITNKYWSAAARAMGHDSTTLMEGFYGAINQRADFDRYLDQMPIPLWPRYLKVGASRYIGCAVALWRYRVFHISCDGFCLGRTPLACLEPLLLALAGRHSVLLPYGADFYRYSRIIDPAVRHALLMSYPAAARNERAIARQVERWLRYATVCVGTFQIDGVGRWDVLPFNHLVIDTQTWQFGDRRSDADGTTGPVRILHTPNHRGAKGTEFLLAAVRKLQAEGLRVELVLLERVPNQEVRRLMRESADILAEQFIFTGYGMSAIEGMASGLPVLANLEHRDYTQMFRRYSYLDECPVLSTSPETLERNLRILIRHPALRRELGMAGRQYVENFHSFSTARELFGAIYRRLAGEQVDLINLFHPLLSPWRQTLPKVVHPLVHGALPPSHPACSDA